MASDVKFDGVAVQSDSRFSEKKVELTRNFINKIWIASRYVLMQIEGVDIKPSKNKTLLEQLKNNK